MLRQQRRTDSLAAVVKNKETQRLREERARAYALVSRAKLDFEKLSIRPLQKPLLDEYTYKWALGGLLALLVSFIFIHL